MTKTWLLVSTLGIFALSPLAFPETQSTTPAASPEATAMAAPAEAPVQPYRTFITIKRYNLESNGIPNKPISNVRLELKLPGGYEAALPEGGQYWTIGNNQSQEINRTFEIPYAFIQKDGMRFDLQLIRKGKKIMPCKFEVNQLSQYNRSYVCHTDVPMQQHQKTTEEKISKEGIEVRVFSDRNTPAAEIPKDAIALK